MPVLRMTTRSVAGGRAAMAGLLALIASAAGADPSQLDGPATGAMHQISENSEFGFRNGSLVVAPIPFSSPLIGSGLALGAGYLFTTDKTSDSSYIGIAGLRSDSGSIGYGAAANVSFGDNRWRLGGLVARADADYDLYLHLGGGTQTIPINQTGTPLDFSVDGSRNSDGDNLLCVYVGQRF